MSSHLAPGVDREGTVTVLITRGERQRQRGNAAYPRAHASASQSPAPGKSPAPGQPTPEAPHRVSYRKKRS